MSNPTSITQLISHIQHGIQNNPKALSSVRHYAFMQGITFNEAIERLAKAYQLFDEFEYTQKTFNKNNNNNNNKNPKKQEFKLIRSEFLSDFSKMFEFSLGPVNVKLEVTLEILQAKASATLQLTAAGVEIFNGPLGEFQVGQKSEFGADVKVASVKGYIELKNDEKNGWSVNFEIQGEITLGFFSKKFGPYTKTLELGKFDILSDKQKQILKDPTFVPDINKEIKLEIQLENQNIVNGLRIKNPHMSIGTIINNDLKDFIVKKNGKNTLYTVGLTVNEGTFDMIDCKNNIIFRCVWKRNNVGKIDFTVIPWSKQYFAKITSHSEAENGVLRGIIGDLVGVVAGIL